MEGIKVGERKESSSLVIYSSSLCRRRACVCSHPRDCTERGQMGKFPTKGSQGTRKWIFFPDQEAQMDNMPLVEKSFYSFEPCFATNMVKFAIYHKETQARMLNRTKYHQEGEKRVVSVHPLNLPQLWTGRQQRNNKPCGFRLSGFRLPNFNIVSKAYHGISHFQRNTRDLYFLLIPMTNATSISLSPKAAVTVKLQNITLYYNYNITRRRSILHAWSNRALRSQQPQRFPAYGNSIKALKGSRTTLPRQAHQFLPTIN